jgi:AbrB family looped-hinge helix DNA binding protein
LTKTDNDIIVVNIVLRFIFKGTDMLISIDKRGSINLPLSVRKELGLDPGTHFDLSIEDGGKITLHPVAIYRTVRLSDQGNAKLQEARESGRGRLPDWLRQEMDNAGTDPHQ